MKNYKVIATRNFIDSEEKVNRIEGKEFECTKERYEFLKSKGAVELVEIQETLKIEPKETIPIKIVEKEIIEEVQAVASEIVDETQEQDKTVEEIINEIVDEMIESEKMNKIIDETVDEVVEEIITKKKKSNKK